MSPSNWPTDDQTLPDRYKILYLYHRTAPVFDLCIRNFQKKIETHLWDGKEKQLYCDAYRRCPLPIIIYNGWITQRRRYTRQLAGQLTVAHGAVRLQPGRTRRGENGRLPRWEETRRGSALHDATRVSFISYRFVRTPWVVYNVPLFFEYYRLNSGLSWAILRFLYQWKHEWILYSLPTWLVAWHSSRRSVIRRRTFSVLRSTCSCRVTTYVTKPSAAGQPTRLTQPFVVSGSSSKLLSDVCYLAQVAPSGECLVLTRWRPGLPDWTVSNLAPFVFGCLLPRAKPGCCCCPAWGLRSIIAVLCDRLLFNPCKVERYVLTIIKKIIIIT